MFFYLFKRAFQTLSPGSMDASNVHNPVYSGNSNLTAAAIDFFNKAFRSNTKFFVRKKIVAP